MLDWPFIANFHFLRPEWLLLLLPFAGLSYLQWRRSDVSDRWSTVIAPHLLPNLIVPGTQRRLFSPLWISVLLSPLLIAAIAGPSWERGESPFAKDAAPLVIAMDLSQSMAEKDLQPSRIQRARDKVLQLAKARGDAYTALLAYSGTAHTVLPLTNDLTVLLHYLDALEVGILPRRGKTPESVVPLAEALLAEGGAGGTLLIVGDGAADNSAEAFQNFGEASEAQLLVWGMGKTQAEIDADAARGLDSRAQPLQETQLKAIADTASGMYLRVTVDDSDVTRLERRINRHFQVSDDSARPWIDGGYYLVPPLMLLFVLWFRAGWVPQW